ncbi:MAG: OmpA family protein [Pseudomonadota bacterium]
MRLKQILPLATIAASLVTGCTTMNPNTGEQKASNATKDAGIGALAGAVLGGLSSSKSDRTKGILTGAVIGGAAGAGVGYYADQQEAKLREKLADSGVSVQRQGQNINLVLPGAITFATGSAQLQAAFTPTLNQVASSLQEFPHSQVQVTGHTDSTGSAANNQQLSQNRANAVAVYLGGRGIQSQRIQTFGMGASQPIASNDSPAGRAQNRRVEIKIIPGEGS